MPVRSLAFLLVLTMLSGGSVPAPLVTERDADLAAGIRLVHEGDFDNAVVKLDAAVREMEAAGRGDEAAQAYLYLGIAYLELDQEALARGKFAQALARQPQMSLDPGEFSPQVIRTFESTRQEALPADPNARASAAGPAAQEGAEQRRKGRSATPYLILGGAAAAAGGVALATNGNPRSSPTPSPSLPPSVSPTPIPCTFTVSPPRQQQFAPEGVTGSCDVVTQSACAWVAESTEPWLVLKSLRFGQGTFGISFKVRPNNSANKRTGEIRFLHEGEVVGRCAVLQLGDTSAANAGASLASWTSELAVPGGGGRLAVDGAFVSIQGPGASPGGRVFAPGAHRFEAVLTAAGGRPGVWRFRLLGGFRVGTLRVLAGEAASISGDAVVFRLAGRPGERVVFAVDAGR